MAVRGSCVNGPPAPSLEARHAAQQVIGTRPSPRALSNTNATQEALVGKSGYALGTSWNKSSDFELVLRKHGFPGCGNVYSPCCRE
jgi:hypothetical protein